MKKTINITAMSSEPDLRSNHVYMEGFIMTECKYVDLTELDDVQESSLASPFVPGAVCGSTCTGIGCGFGCFGGVCGAVCY